MASGTLQQKNGRWYARIELAPINGKRQRISIPAGTDRKQAERLMQHEIDYYENGGQVTARENMSVSDYFDFWMHDYAERNLKYNTIKNYRNIVNKYIKPRIGKYAMRNIKPATMQEFIDAVASDVNEKSKKKLSKHTVEIVLTVTKEALKRAVFPYQILRDNPASYVEMPRYAPEPKKTRQDLKIITFDQYEEILKITPPADPFHMPLVIAFNTGMRRGEVLGLTWDHVSLEDGTIDVVQQMIQRGDGRFELETPKSAAGFRTITIGPTLIRELTAQRKRQMENRLRYGQLYQESNFVCTRENGEPVQVGRIKYSVRTIQDKLGFPFTFHSLRHTHATMLLDSGEKMKIVQDRLGHSKMSTTADTYTHVTRKMRNSTVARFEDFMNNQRREN